MGLRASIVDSAVADERSDALAARTADRLPPHVASGLRGITRVARALTTAGSLHDVTERALEAMLVTLELEAAALYLRDVSGRPLLRRFMALPGEAAHAPRERIDFDDAAWELAVAGGHPLVFNEPAGWLGPNPFEPPASHWLVMPLATAERLAGAVVAVPSRTLELDQLRATVLSLLGEQLAAGIVNAQLRQDLQQAAIERERHRVAAEVHDGLAQDLALAMRELAFLDTSPPAADARASQERLRAAVADAHAVVRDRLLDLSPPIPIGGLGSAVEEACDRFARRGLPVRLEAEPPPVDVAPQVTAAIIRVLNEALANAARHAAASRVDVRFAVGLGTITIAITDDGCGFDRQQGRAEGHLGLSLMRVRAAEAAGEVEIDARPGAGTTVIARFPV
jgi:signal transduction histidine kinase